MSFELTPNEQRNLIVLCVERAADFRDKASEAEKEADAEHFNRVADRYHKLSMKVWNYAG